MITEREPICAAGSRSADVWMQPVCMREATLSGVLLPQTKHANQQQQCIREIAVQRRLVQPSSIMEASISGPLQP